MNIHEYQAKEILKNFGVKIQNGFVAETPKDAKTLAEKLSKDDTLSVFNETDKILKSMSKESTPHLLEIDTHRWFDHVGVGTSNEFKYRDKSEITKKTICNVCKNQTHSKRLNRVSKSFSIKL
mgnify:CR=1 FL=1